ncbi:MAG: hypothetical protein R6X02_31035 [Enhygromyxa sp.]
MTTATATWPSRWRFSRAAWALALAPLLLGGCGEPRRAQGDVVAKIDAPQGALELDRRVVRMLAEREGLSEAEAEQRALDRLRWVAARRAELAERQTPPEHPDDLDPARREHLERAALVRLWLREVFEPGHTAATIPGRVVSRNMADPALTQRLFHPELWFVCQALIVPREKGEDGRSILPPSEGEAADRWRADAASAFAPLVARVEAVAEELVDNDDCSLLGQLVSHSERDFETDSGALTIRFERFAFAPSEVQFDPSWLEQVTAQPEPRLIGPFPTPFGLHVVVLTKIEPAALAEGSQPPEQLAAAREVALREAIELSWRADQLQRTLAEARDRRVVRLAAELE